MAMIMPQCARIATRTDEGRMMTDRTEIYDIVAEQIAPFNKKDIALTEATTFQGDLEWDSLTVMDFVAAIEDEFDIMITMNMQAEIETVGQLIDAVAKLKA
jgi:acyl carrier protein